MKLESFYEPLTLKEREVMGYLERSVTAREIATAMSVSINTVKHHVRNIYAKLDVRSREHAVTRYMHMRGIHA